MWWLVCYLCHHAVWCCTYVHMWCGCCTSQQTACIQDHTNSCHIGSTSANHETGLTILVHTSAHPSKAILACSPRPSKVMGNQNPIPLRLTKLCCTVQPQTDSARTIIQWFAHHALSLGFCRPVVTGFVGLSCAYHIAFCCRAITFVLQEVGVYDICIKHRSNWELAKVSLGINPPTTTGMSVCLRFLAEMRPPFSGLKSPS